MPSRLKTGLGHSRQFGRISTMPVHPWQPTLRQGLWFVAMGHKRTFHRNLDSAVGGFNLRGELAEWNSADRSSDRARSLRNIAVKSSDTRLLTRRESNQRPVALRPLPTFSAPLPPHPPLA